MTPASGVVGRCRAQSVAKNACFKVYRLPLHFNTEDFELFAVLILAQLLALFK